MFNEEIFLSSFSELCELFWSRLFPKIKAFFILGSTSVFMLLLGDNQVLELLV